MAPHALQRMTPEEFYRWPGEDGVRYELVDGFPSTAMTGASWRKISMAEIYEDATFPDPLAGERAVR